MKKLALALALVLVLTLGLASIAAAEEEHQHSWALIDLPNIYIHQYICTICHQIEYEDHWDDCTAPDVCGGCGKTVENDGIIINMHYHTWDDYTVSKTEHWHYCTSCGNEYHRGTHDDDCDNPGVCRVCGKTEADGIVITTHWHIWDDYSYNETEHWHFCTRCGNEYHRDEHGDNCDNLGVCAECGKTEADGIQINARWHIWDGYSYDETEHWYHCERCGNDYYRSAHWNNCLDSDICAECGIPFHGEVYHINNNLEDYKLYDEENHQFICENCHELIIEKHSFEDGVCTYCGYAKSEIAAPEYKLQNLQYSGKAVTGKLVHTAGTAEAESLSIRVTFFITGNYYMATVAEVEADGSFVVEGVGPIEYISVLAIGQENGESKTYSAGELYM